MAEVPLEDLFFGRVKALVKDRSKNPAGHVQFFTRNSFLALVTAMQYSIVDERVYAPCFNKETLQFAYGDKGLLRYLGKVLTEHYLPKHTSRLWTRWYHATMQCFAKNSRADRHDSRSWRRTLPTVF